MLSHLQASRASTTHHSPSPSCGSLFLIGTPMLEAVCSRLHHPSLFFPPQDDESSIFCSRSQPRPLLQAADITECHSPRYAAGFSLFPGSPPPSDDVLSLSRKLGVGFLAQDLSADIRLTGATTTEEDLGWDSDAFARLARRCTRCVLVSAAAALQPASARHYQHQATDIAEEGVQESGVCVGWGEAGVRGEGVSSPRAKGMWMVGKNGGFCRIATPDSSAYMCF